jgi:uncharacterized protein with PIN domain
MSQKELIKDYQDHGYQLTSNENGVMIFDTDYELSSKNNKFKKHPIYLKESTLKARSIIKNICYQCNAPIIDDECSVCKKIYRTPSKKEHIDYVD